MLDLALKAQLPLIGIRTRDTLNIASVIKYAAGKVPIEYDPNTPLPKESVGFMLLNDKKLGGDMRHLYDKLVMQGSSLILVNMAAPHELVFEAGDPATPKKLMHDLLVSVVEDSDKASELMSALGGCTLKETAEFARLTMARDHSLTAQGLSMTRRACFGGTKGLQQVGTEQDYYAPPMALSGWVENERPMFLYGTDKRLVPRGLLFDGPPGTGKTEASKYIAREFGVPLYRIHVGSVMNKYVGDSEANMSSALSQLDNEEPCVALFDEVEKMFSKNTNDSTGVMTSMLSQLLWWMVERKSRVLVVMTTNKSESIPDELYRPGRIDTVMELKGVDHEEAKKMAYALVYTFKEVEDKQDSVLASLEYPIERLFSNTKGNLVPQAKITKAVYEAVKMSLL